MPVLIAGVTLASRRWGPRVGGFVNALPAVAGPTLCFYAVQQGRLFAADAARGSMLGLIGVAAFCVVYAHASRRLRVAVCLIVGWMAFGAVSLMVYRLPVGPATAFVLAVAALLAARAGLPSHAPPGNSTGRPKWDLPLRMLTAAVLVFVLTSLADRLGPGVSGVLTPFPVATAIVAGFTHAQQGAAASVAFLRGFLPALCGFAVFCLVLATTLATMSLAASVALALAVQLVYQTWLLRRR